MKRFWKSKINKRLVKSASKIGLTVFAVVMILSISKIHGTNSFFTDTAGVTGNTMTAGYWIPVLSMSVDKTPDADGFYRETPCVTLTASVVTDVKIYYKFSNIGDPSDGGTLYDGVCVPIPDGNPTQFEAVAVNNANPDWKSNIVDGQFKVDTAVAHPGDVVINEVMWMGSLGHSHDEWIELRNMTDHEIDISQWKIENAKSGHQTYDIPSGKTIEAHGYFLISNYPKSSSSTELNVEADDHDAGISLANSNNGNLVLKTSAGDTIDGAKGDHWPAGWNGVLFKMSMERNKTPGNGLDASNWHTCIDPRANETKYWKHDGFDFGTPRDENLSKNDPSDPDFVGHGNDLPPEIIAGDTEAQNDNPIVGDSAATANDQAPAVSDPVPAVATGSAPSDQPVTGDVTPPVVEPKIISKEFDINLSGKLDIPDGFAADTEQKMKKIELSGEESAMNDFKDPEIDLSKIEIKAKADKIEILVSDLNLPKDISLVSAKDDDAVLAISVTEKPIDDPKKDKQVSPQTDAAVPAKSDVPTEDKKDETATGSDSNNNSAN